jgi:hypothetical protein
MFVILPLYTIGLVGEFHYKRGVRSEYLDVMGPLFTHTIRPILLHRKLWSIHMEEVQHKVHIYLEYHGACLLVGMGPPSTPSP